MHVKPLFRSDPSSPERLRINVRNSRLPAWIARRLDRQVARRFTAGLESAVIRSIDISTALGVTDAERAPLYSKIADCVSNVVTIPSPESHAVTMTHFASLFFLCISGLATASLVAFSERLSWRLSRLSVQLCVSERRE